MGRELEIRNGQVVDRQTPYVGDTSDEDPRETTPNEDETDEEG